MYLTARPYLLAGFTAASIVAAIPLASRPAVTCQASVLPMCALPRPSQRWPPRLAHCETWRRGTGLRR